MGPYCKFCETRCFTPTTRDDYIKTDLKATCIEGIKFDLTATYSLIVDTNYNTKYWMYELRRGQETSIALQLIGDQVSQFEINNNDFYQAVNLSSEEMLKKIGNNTFYRLTK